MKADRPDSISSKIPVSIKSYLAKRRDSGNLRSLIRTDGWIDFSSNDYLGLGQNQELAAQIRDRVEAIGLLMNGGTGSRLISGNHKYFKETEELLARVFDAEACLLFNSGYAANQAVVASIPQRGDTILYDQLAHICLKEGAWLSKASSFAFAHNDLNDLESRLKRAEGTIYVVTETVFSMDGDIAPLEEMIRLCEKYSAWLIVDEAHSTGVYGHNGGGWLVEKGLYDQVLARVYTFGKAMGVHGACVAGSRDLIDYLINFGRSFIYTTSLPPHSVISIKESFNYLSTHKTLQEELQRKITLFQTEFKKATSDTAVQPVLIPGNEEAKQAASFLQSEGMDVRAILAPTVKEGTERLRVSLHVHNTEDQIRDLAQMLTSLQSS